MSIAFLSRAASMAVATAFGSRGVFAVEVDAVVLGAGEEAVLLLRDLGVAMQSVYRSIQTMSDDMPLHGFRHQTSNRPAGCQLLANLRRGYVSCGRFDQVDAGRGPRFACVLEWSQPRPESRAVQGRIERGAGTADDGQFGAGDQLVEGAQLGDLI